MDYDGDGDLDILSGSYTGEIYYFECKGERNFIQGRRLTDQEGEDLKSKSYSITVEAWDMDQDGDLDLVLGTRTSSVEIFENTGTRKKPVYSEESKPLKTRSGNPLKGSNAHMADWDGNGALDLVLGSEYGGVHWYPNLGTTQQPEFGEKQVLIAEGKFKRRILEEGPEGAGSRTKVFVVDYDGDGLSDLLVGDVQWLYTTLPPLTPEQEAEKARIMPEYTRVNEALDAVFEERNSFVGKEGGIPKELEERLDKLLEEFRPLAKEMGKFDREKSSTHGWVWLYRQKEAPSR